MEFLLSRFVCVHVCVCLFFGSCVCVCVCGWVGGWRRCLPTVWCLLAVNMPCLVWRSN